jgi:RNA polymerase sigma-70 factor, ECF subfamily
MVEGITLAAKTAIGLAISTAQSEENLLEVAVREHARLVYRIAYSVLRNAAEAEDAVQEVFLRALRYGKKLAGVVDCKAWLAQIAWRVAVEHRRRVTQDATQNAYVENADGWLLSPEHGAERILLEKERDEFLQQMIGGLPDQLRDALVLSAFEELSPREIGTMLGISEAAVRSRAFRARQILRDRLSALNGPRT